MVKYAKEHGVLDIYFNTNAMFLDERMSRRLIEAGHLKSSIQAKYQLNDNMVSKALDFALKSSDENPGVTKVIQKVRDMMRNPEEAPDLIMFLMNPNEFIKQKSNQTVSEEKKRIYKMISRTPKERTTSPIDDKGKEVVGVTFDEIRLD